MASKFDIIITVFEACKIQISILNTKYFKFAFEKLRVRKNDIMIAKLSKNNSNKSNNEYYNLECIFEKFTCDALQEKDLKRPSGNFRERK